MSMTKSNPKTTAPQNDAIGRKKILLVDLPPYPLSPLHSALAEHFDVTPVASLEECREVIDMLEPDLLFADATILGTNERSIGEAFQKNKRASIIFLAQQDNSEMRIRALEAGAEDVMIGPFNPDDIVHKAQQIFAAKDQQAREKANQESMQNLLFTALRNVGEKGILVDFQRQIMSCRDHVKLAQHIINTAQAYEINCHVQIRGKHGALTYTPHGPATPLEESVVEHARTLGQHFKFKRRFVVNFEAITILAIDLPTDDYEASFGMQDNMTLLAEGAQQVVDAIDIWSESGRQIEDMQTVSFQAHYGVEDLKARYKEQQGNIRNLLNKLITDVEDNYVYLGLSESQESKLSNSIRSRADEIIELVEAGQSEVEEKFDSILKLLRTEDDDSIELF